MNWLLQQRLSRIRRRVLVVSNKGGVGKSTVSVGLAAGLAAGGQRVGLVDADFHGPNLPHMLGVADQRLRSGPEGIIPVTAAPNLVVASVAFMLPTPDEPVIWRDAYKAEFMAQLLSGVAWGDLDWLVVDMPPGTGGEHLTAVDLLGRVDGAVIVTTPQEVALLDARKTVAWCRESDLPILGVVENMSGLVCPHCAGEIHPFRQGGGEKLARTVGVPFLGRVPLDPAVMLGGDAGRPRVLTDPEADTSRALRAIADRLRATPAAGAPAPELQAGGDGV